jgi:hypothetical protein
MAPTYEAGLCLVTHFYQHVTLPREAVITFATNVPDPNDSAQDVAESLQLVWTTWLAPTTDSQVSLVRTQTLKGLGGQVFQSGTSTAPGVPGQFVTNTVQSNTAALVQKRTGLGGREGRGRVYLPWALSEGAVDEVGRIDSVARSQIQTAMDGYLAAYGGQMVLAHRIYDLPWNDPARQLIAVTKGPLVTALLASNVCATQRRRMPRN